MTTGRYAELMADLDAELGTLEVYEGWHFCSEWDGLLVGPDMPEWYVGSESRLVGTCVCGHRLPKLIDYDF